MSIGLGLILAAVFVAAWVAVAAAQRARRRIAASEVHYRGLFESAGEGIAGLDEAGVILQANARLADLLGAPQDRIVGRQLGAFYVETPVSGAATVSGEYAAAMGGAVPQHSMRLLLADGSLVD